MASQSTIGLRIRSTYSFTILLTILITSGINFKPVSAQVTPTNGETILQMMYDHYSEKGWYKNFTFWQQTSFYKDDSLVREQKWYEAISLPGKLVIKYDSINGRNGMLFRNNKIYRMADGKIAAVQKLVHTLLLAGFDVYFQPVKRTIHMLDSLGFDLSKVRQDEFLGRKVWVVGAEAGDLQSQQIWIDAERLYLHRIVYQMGNQVSMADLDEYKELNGNWVATRIRFYKDGHLTMKEIYKDIHFPTILNERLFHPENFASSRW